MDYNYICPKDRKICGTYQKIQVFNFECRFYKQFYHGCFILLKSVAMALEESF